MSKKNNRKATEINVAEVEEAVVTDPAVTESAETKPEEQAPEAQAAPVDEPDLQTYMAVLPNGRKVLNRSRNRKYEALVATQRRDRTELDYWGQHAWTSMKRAQSMFKKLSGMRDEVEAVEVIEVTPVAEAPAGAERRTIQRTRSAKVAAPKDDVGPEAKGEGFVFDSHPGKEEIPEFDDTPSATYQSRKEAVLAAKAAGLTAKNVERTPAGEWEIISVSSL